MVSFGFDAVAGLSGLSFTFKGVMAGKVHRVTRAATTRSDLHMLQVGGGLDPKSTLAQKPWLWGG
jgi:hypothetical protein